MGSSLQIYMNTYFWEFKSIMLASYLGIYVLSTISAFLLVPALVKVIEKRTILIIGNYVCCINSANTYIFIYQWFFPASGTWDLFYATIPFVYIGNTCLSSSAIIRESMLGDISDEVELESKIGQQGLMFASSSLIGKLNTGLGILMAGIALRIYWLSSGLWM